MALDYKILYLLFAFVNILGALSLFISIIIGITQIIINHTVGKKIDESIAKIKNIFKEDDKEEVVDIYGDNIILVSMFIITFIVGFGLILKGFVNIMSENTNNIMNSHINKCYILKAKI